MLKSKSSLGGSNPRLLSARDELMNNRYTLTEPEGVYPLDPQQSTLKYPDFLSWKHTKSEDEIAISHLQKSYFEGPHVGNELLSARNIMHQLLKSKNSLDEVSLDLSKAIDLRSVNNKVGQCTHKPPPRVTLTDQKREAWLKDLAQRNVPLRRLARTIPHGVRNKVLLEQCIAKNIPIPRAIWFVRCVSTNELRGLKRKGGANVEFNWVQEWTTQVVEFIERLSQDYLRFETFHQATDSWKFKINYILRFASNLFIENLIDRDTFKNWIVKFFKNCKNFELPLSLTIIQIFWDDILKTDYLIKELTEHMTLRYQKVLILKSMLNDVHVSDTKLNEQIKNKLLDQLSNLIISSFNNSIDNFIFPSNWIQFKPILKSILRIDDPTSAKKFELISYRNESLMINYSLNSDIVVKDFVTTLDNSEGVVSLSSENWRSQLKILINWGITKYRSERFRALVVSESLKSLKQEVSLKEIEQELLNIIFTLHHDSGIINFENLYLLINELAQSKIFKDSIYIRRLISSGLVYLTDNQQEKLLHASILRNLRPHKSSQATMILKNLDSTSVSAEDFLTRGTQILKEIFVHDVESINFLTSLDVGVKLSLSDFYLSTILSKDNILPLLTYNEFEGILRVFGVLKDTKNSITFLVKTLESGQLDLDKLDLISKLVVTNSKIFNVVGLLSDITQLLLVNYNRVEKNPTTNFLEIVSQYEDVQKLIDETGSFADTKQRDVDETSTKNDLALLGLDISIQEFFRADKFHNTFYLLIKALFTGTNSKQSITQLLQALKSTNSSEFNKSLFVFIKKTYSNANELFKYEPILDLVIPELISINVVTDTFLSFNSTIYTTFIRDLLFKDFSQLETHDFFKLNLIRDQFKASNSRTMLHLMKLSLFDNEAKFDSIQSESTELINSLLPENTQYKSEFLSVFLDILIKTPKLVVETLVGSSPNDKLITLLYEILYFNEEEVHVSRPFERLLSTLRVLNRFNLPIFQLLFKITLSEETSDDEISRVITSVFDNFDSEGNIHGSLFELLDSKLKLRFIHRLESLFLNSKTFPFIQINGSNIELNVFSDILTSLSSGLQFVELKDELVFSLDISLESLLKVVTQSEKANDSICDVVFLFLKIIIIHKSFLVGIILERNSIKESFLNNIVALLTTKFVSQNLQLKNLLYDLIISIKSSINEQSLNQVNGVKLPASILSLPSISAGFEKKQNISILNQNLHDHNILSTLYLYQRATSTFHDLNLKSFDLLEDSNPIENINDTAISLQLFEASLERKNPSI